MVEEPGWRPGKYSPRRSTTGHCAGLCAWLFVVCALDVDRCWRPNGNPRLPPSPSSSTSSLLSPQRNITTESQATKHHSAREKNNMRKAITVKLSIANSNSIISRTGAPEITAATARQSATAVSSGSDRIPFSHVPIS